MHKSSIGTFLHSLPEGARILLALIVASLVLFTLSIGIVVVVHLSRTPDSTKSCIKHQGMRDDFRGGRNDSYSLAIVCNDGFSYER